MHKSLFPLFIFFLLLSVPQFAFNQNAIDSLKKALDESDEDSNRVNILYALWKEYIYIDNSMANENAVKQYIISKKINFPQGLSRSLYCLGFCYVNEGDYAKALHFSQKARSVSEETGDFNVKFLSLEQIGAIYYYQERYKDAIASYKELLEEAQVGGSPAYIAGTYCSMGASYLNLQRYDSSLCCFRNSLSGYKNLNQNDKIALATANIGDVYKEMDSLPTAMKYYSEALTICTEKENSENKDNVVFIYYSMGEVAGRMGAHVQSLEYFNKALALSEEISDRKFVKKEIYERLSAEYERHGDLKNAIICLKLFQQLKDSLLNEKSIEQINDLHAKYASEKKDKKIKLLKKEMEIEKMNIKMHRTIIWSVSGGALALAAIIILLILGYRQKQKLNLVLEQKVRERTSELTAAGQKLQNNLNELVEKERLLQQLNSELNILLYRISHDLRTPLISVMGLVNVFKMNNNPDDKAKCLTMIDTSVRNMDIILTNLATINIVREAKLKLEPVNIDILAEGIFNIYKVRPDLQAFVLVKSIESGLTINTDQGIFHSLLQNLVDNAIKYRKLGIPNPSVTVTAFSSSGGITLIVEDNGIGMSPEIAQKAFDLFYKGSTEIPGSGLGLYLVKKAVESLKGTIKVESRWAVGTKFEVFLPELK